MHRRRLPRLAAPTIPICRSPVAPTAPAGHSDAVSIWRSSAVALRHPSYRNSSRACGFSATARAEISNRSLGRAAESQASSCRFLGPAPIPHRHRSGIHAIPLRCPRPANRHRSGIETSATASHLPSSTQQTTHINTTANPTTPAVAGCPPVASMHSLTQARRRGRCQLVRDRRDR